MDERTARSRTKASTFFVGALLAMLGAGVGWSLHALVFPGAAEADDASEDAAPEIAADDMLVRVSTADVVRGDLSLVVAAGGVVKAAPGADHVLSSRASGRVLEALVSRGQVVKQGTVLLRFETAPLEAALAQARAALAQADSQLAEFERTGRDRQSDELHANVERTGTMRTLAEAQLARLQPLHADGLVSDKALAEADQAVRQARSDQEIAERTATAFQSSAAELQHATLVATRASADANLRESERVLAEAEVRAPADGQITEFSARSGERLEPGAMIGRLLAEGGRVVSFAVPAKMARSLALGGNATWEDQGGAACSGKIVGLGGEVDAQSGLVEVIVEPESTTPLSSPGLTVRGEFELQHLSGALIVPDRAVLRSHDAQVVVVATPEGRAKVTSVNVLGRHGGLVAVEGAIEAGDHVVVDGGYNLPDGARIVATPAKTAAALPSDTGATAGEPRK